MWHPPKLRKHHCCNRFKLSIITTAFHRCRQFLERWLSMILYGKLFCLGLWVLQKSQKGEIKHEWVARKGPHPCLNSSPEFPCEHQLLLWSLEMHFWGWWGIIFILLGLPGRILWAKWLLGMTISCEGAQQGRSHQGSHQHQAMPAALGQAQFLPKSCVIKHYANY